MSCFFPVFSENIKSSSVPDAATFSWGEVGGFIFQLVMVEVRNGKRLIDVSNEKILVCLGYIGDYI